MGTAGTGKASEDWVDGGGVNRASVTWTRVNAEMALLVHRTGECFLHTLLPGGARRHLRCCCRRAAHKNT